MPMIHPLLNNLSVPLLLFFLLSQPPTATWPRYAIPTVGSLEQALELLD